MKRLLLSLVLAMMLFAGVACAEGWIAPAELSEAENAILELMGMGFDTTIFDYAAPAEANAIRLTMWELTDGQWQMRNEDTFYFWDETGAGRIALRSGECIAFDLYAAVSCNDSGASSSVYLEEPDFDLYSYGWMADSLFERTTVGMDAQQPLLMQFLFAGDGAEGVDLGAFVNPGQIVGCDRAYAVTVAFVHEAEESEDSLYGDDWDDSWSGDDVWSDADWYVEEEEPEGGASLLDQLLDHFTN